MRSSSLVWGHSSVGDTPSLSSGLYVLQTIWYYCPDYKVSQPRRTKCVSSVL